MKSYKAMVAILKTYVFFVPNLLELTVVIFLSYHFDHKITYAWLYVFEIRFLNFLADFGSDIPHALMHVFLKSRYKFIRSIGSLHMPHHKFFNSSLKHNNDFILKNLFYHLIPEFLTQAAIVAVCFFILGPVPVIAWFLEYTHTFIQFVLLSGYDNVGKDLIHMELDRALPHAAGYRVDPHYHALHHIYPDNYYCGYNKTLDYILGSGCQIRGKSVALFSKGIVGKIIKQRILENAPRSVVEISWDSDSDKLEKQLQGIEILILSSEFDVETEYGNSHYQNYSDLSEAFLNVAHSKLYPKELWAFGCDNEAFNEYATYCYQNTEFVYRHIVHFGNIKSERQAMAIVNRGFFLIKRGFHFIPVNSFFKALKAYRRLLRSQKERDESGKVSADNQEEAA